MWLLVSGEGKNDIGRCNPSASPQFEVGSMTIIIDQLINIFQGYECSYIDYKLIHFISEKELARLSKQLDPKRKLTLAGKKRKKETLYYEKNARALAQHAKYLKKEENDDVMAILFRDADGTQSSSRGEWQEKWNSIQRGFELEKFDKGVPMLPNPKSEAWLLCALKEAPYQHCEQLENESGNDKSPNSLKKKLQNRLEKRDKTTDHINDLLKNGTINITQIDMPSFNTFKQSLQEKTNLIHQIDAAERDVDQKS